MVKFKSTVYLESEGQVCDWHTSMRYKQVSICNGAKWQSMACRFYCHDKNHFVSYWTIIINIELLAHHIVAAAHLIV